MKRMKKIFAVILSLAMVMGMSLTAFAEGEEVTLPAGTIQVTGAEKATAVQYVQIIKPSQTSKTGWTFTEAGNGFKTQWSGSDDEIIAGLIRYKDANSSIPTGITPVTISASTLEAALNKVTDYSTNFTKSGDVYTTVVNDAGVYAIKATQATDAKEAYSPMAAYISFEYSENGSVPSSNKLGTALVTAKKVDITVEKEATDETDKVTAVNEVEGYKIKTTVPYIPDSVTTVKYNIKDKLTGAKYLTSAKNAENLTFAEDDKVNIPVKVKLGDGNEEDRNAVYNKSDNSFTLDLKDIASNRANANKPLEITYNVYVTAVIVDNEAKSEVSKTDTEDFQTTPDTETLYTGSITITKKGEDDTKLKGAEFVVYYEMENVKHYATVEDGKVKSWVTNKDDASHIITGDDGTATVKGFNDSVTYYFEEVKAPEGYSLNNNPATVTWDDASVANDKKGTAEITDTKLSSLPSTGGIGTTIFTIGGCAIMIIAAALFFASRRKEAK